MQRFGTSSLGTHIVGRALLKQDYATAIQTVLEPRPEDTPDIAKARTYWKETRDARGTLDIMPRWMVVDRQLLLGLQKHGGQQYLNAFYSVRQDDL
jgi:tRNA pseudouridine13 synthase